MVTPAHTAKDAAATATEGQALPGVQAVQEVPGPQGAAGALHVPEPAEPTEPPRYLAWTDRWDPGKWETPDNPTRLQKVLAGIALVIVLVMTVWVPLRLLKIL